MTEQDAGDKGPSEDPTVNNPVRGKIGFSMSRAFSDAWMYFGRKSGLYIGLSLVFAIPVELAELATGGGIILPLLAAALFGAISEGAITLGALRQVKGHPVGGDLASSVLQFYGAILVAYAITIVLFAIGLIFLIVPGIIVLSLFFFAIPAIVGEQANGLKGIERSVALGRGSRLEIFLMVLLFAVVWMGGSFLLDSMFGGVALIGGIVTWLYDGMTAAFGTVLAVTGYIQLREIEGNPLSVETAE